MKSSQTLHAFIALLVLCALNSDAFSTPTKISTRQTIYNKVPGHNLVSTCKKSQSFQRSTSTSNSRLNVIEKAPTTLYHESEIIEKIHKLRKSLRSTLLGIVQGTTLALRQSWWCFPMLLMFVPIICIMNGSCAQMPTWWSLSNLEHLHSSKVGAAICIGFLSSNVFYFLSGLYLLNPKPLQRHTVSHNRHGNVLELNNKQAKRILYNDGRHPMLGWLVLCSGGVSLIYHSFQAMGSLNIAESLCFVDHGLALSAGCYFFDKCGAPSFKTWIIGILSLSFLAVSGDIYPILHSFWHLGSAGVTVSWASDGAERRRKFISESLRSRRRLNRLKKECP